MTITAYFDFEAEDLVRAHRIMFRDVRRSRVMLYVAILVLITVYAVAARPLDRPFAGIILSLDAACVALIVLAPWLQGRAVRRMYERTPMLHEEQTYEFSEQGLRTSSQLATAEFKWAGFQRVRETRDYFLLFLGQRRASVFPKRALKTPADLEALRALIAEQMRALGRRFDAYDPTRQGWWARIAG